MIRLLHSLEEMFISLLLVAMTLLVFSEVIARFGFNSGIHWAQEVTLLLAAWFVLFGASYGLRTGAHICVDVALKRFPNNQQRFFALLAVVLCIIYCGFFLYGSWIYISKMKMIGIELEDIPLPKWIPMNVLIIGFSLLVIRLLSLATQIIKGKQQGFHLVSEASESMKLAKDLEQDQL